MVWWYDLAQAMTPENAAQESTRIGCGDGLERAGVRRVTVRPIVATIVQCAEAPMVVSPHSFRALRGSRRLPQLAAACEMRLMSRRDALVVVRMVPLLGSDQTQRGLALRWHCCAAWPKQQAVLRLAGLRP